MHVSYPYAVLSGLAYETSVAAAEAKMPTSDAFGYSAPILYQNSAFSTPVTLPNFTAMSADFAVTVFQKGSQYVLAFRGSESFGDFQDDFFPGRGIAE